MVRVLHKRYEENGVHSSQRTGATSAQAVHDLARESIGDIETETRGVLRESIPRAALESADGDARQGDEHKSQINAERQAGDLVVQFFDVRDGVRSQPFLSTRAQLADVLRKGEFNGISLDQCGVLVLMDKVTDEWTYSQCPILSAETFVKLAEGK